MRRVELLYFPGCPHIEAARGQLRRAFDALGLEPQWREFDVTAPAALPEHRDRGSPTILVDGRDVAGTDERAAGAACRLYLDTDVPGAPALRLVTEALRALR